MLETHRRHFEQDKTGPERIEKGKMKTSSSQNPSPSSSKISDNSGKYVYTYGV